MPAFNFSPEEIANEPTLDDTVKEYLSDSRFRIRLDDLAAREVRAVAQAFQKPEFSMTAAMTSEA